MVRSLRPHPLNRHQARESILNFINKSLMLCGIITAIIIVVILLISAGSTDKHVPVMPPTNHTVPVDDHQIFPTDDPHHSVPSGGSHH
jgi:hypothetical protein